MASQVHSTLVGDAVTTVTLDQSNTDKVVLTYVSGTGPVYFTVDGSTPVLAANDTYVLTATSAQRTLRVTQTDALVVKLLSATADKVAVEGIAQV